MAENEIDLEDSTPLTTPSTPILSSEDLLAKADSLWQESEGVSPEGPVASQSFRDPTGLDEQLDPQAALSRYSGLTTPQEEDPSYWADAGRGFAYGGLGFVESLLDLSGDAGNTAIWLAEKAGLNEEGGFRFGEVDLNDAFKPKTWLGNAIGGITQVAAGYALTAATLGLAAPASIAATAAGAGVVAGRYGRFLKYAAFTKESAWGRFRRGMTIGAIADFVAFKEHEDRLSNLIQSVPMLKNPITQYLAADKSDNWLEGRLKNALEGSGIGAFAEFALLPILRTQKAVKAKLREGKFNEAMGIQRAAGDKFLENLTTIKDGEEVIVLHNVDYLRQYLTLLPDMDPNKMHAAVALFRTAARLHNFKNLNAYLQQGMRTATLNQSLPGGTLGNLDHSIFSNIDHLGAGRSGPLGDGTPYALFEENSISGIEDILKNEKISFTTHTRTNRISSESASGSEEKIFIAPGLSVEQAKAIATRSNKDSFVTNHGIYKSVDDDTGMRWKIRPLSDVSVSRVGSKIINKDAPGAYKFINSEGIGVRYDLKYLDDLEEISSLPASKDRIILAHSSENPKSVIGEGDSNFSAQGFPEGSTLKGTSIDDYANLNDVLRTYRGVSVHKIEDTMALLGKTPPEYLESVTNFLERQKSRAVNGEITARHLIKSALMTEGSRDSGPRTWAHAGVEGLTKERAEVGVKARLQKSMRHSRDSKGEVIGPGVDIGEMKKDFDYYKKKQREQGVDTRSDEFMTFIEWVGTDPSKGTSWRLGEQVGGRTAFRKSQFKGAQENSPVDLVRPGEYVSLWMMSPNGRTALDALENGEVLTHLWAELKYLRAALAPPVGGIPVTRKHIAQDPSFYSRASKMMHLSYVPKILRLNERVANSSKVERGFRTKFNVADLQGMVDRFNKHMVKGTLADGTVKKGWKGRGDWDADYIGSIFKELSGATDVSEDFMKHLLGIGDTATIGSDQLRFWLTGLKEGQMGAKGSVGEMNRLLYSKVTKMMKGKDRQNFIEKVKERNEGLLERLEAGNIVDEDLTANVLNHWLWDKVMDSDSITDSASAASIFAQRSTIGTIKGAVTFGGDGEAILNLFTKKFTDRYGRKYEASDFSTIVHEMAHIYRRAMKNPIALRRKEAGQLVEGFQRGPSYEDAIDKIETFLNVKDGKWTVRQEERFAKMFEKWIIEGAEVEGLERPFRLMQGWMQELYRNVHNSPMKSSITPEITGIFAKMFGKEGLPTFLTPKDHDNLTKSFEQAIQEGQSLTSSLETVGMNLRQWADETEVGDVFQGLVNWLSKGKILEKFKNSLQKPGEGGVGPRGFGPPGVGSTDVNVQYNKFTKGVAENLADELGTNHDALAAKLRETAGLSDDMPEHFIAGKMLLNSYCRNIYQVAQKVASGEGGLTVKATLKLLQDKFVDIYTSVLRIQRGSARTVQAGNIPIEGLDPDQMYQIILNAGGHKKVELLAQDLITGADNFVGKVSFKQLRQMSRNQLFWDMTHEWRINGLLSSMKSLTIDLVSTTLHTLLLPAERIAGGLLMGDRELLHEGISLYYGYANGLKEALRIGWMGGDHGTVWRALKREKQIVDPMVRTTETLRNAWSKDRIRQVFPDAQGMKPSGLLAGFFHYAGFWVRWPSRLRLGGKELFDTVSYRARYRQILMKEALNKFPHIEPKKAGPSGQGKVLDLVDLSESPKGAPRIVERIAEDTRDIKALRLVREENIAKYIVENMESGYDDMGRGINKDALQYAREVNFSEPLVDGLGAVVSNARYKLPGLSLLLPFVRTPTWLIRGFIGRSFGGLAMLPVIGDIVATLNPALKAIREDFLAGGARQAKALGKVSTASVFYGTAVVLAYEGQTLPGGKKVRIVGSGPPDPAQRKIWESGGKIANSVEITDAQGNKKYIGFDRLDPFWMFFGMAADFVQLAQYLTDDQLEDIASFGVLALANRLDGAYMKGAIDAAGAWSEGGGKLEHFLANMVKSFVPRIAMQNPFHGLSEIPGLEGLEGLDDEYRRERESVHTAWMTILPVLWDKYGVKYDTITGHPIKKHQAWGENIPYIGGVVGEMSPFLYSESRAEDNPMSKIAEMLYGFGPPSPKKSTGGADLDLRDLKTDYEDDDGIRVRNVYQAWQKEIGKLPVEKILNRLTYSPIWDKLDRDTQITKVRSTLRNLRELAFGILQAKNKDLRKLITNASVSRIKSKINTAMSKRLSL